MTVHTPETLRGETDGLANLPDSKHSNGYANSIVVKTGAGVLYGFTVYSSNAAAQFIQVFDAAAVPADTAVPTVLLTVAAAGNLGVTYIPGRKFLYGIVLCNSSTGPTKTIGAADCFFDAQFD